MNRENNNSETGAIMVEAAIYFPITIGIVMVVLYFGLFKLQESYFFFQVERAATELAREASYPGYDSFTDENPLKNSKVDFDWENGPSESQTKSYYAAYKGSASKIYRWGVDSKLARRAADYQQALQKNSALFSMGRTEAYVKVNSSFLSKSVQAEPLSEYPFDGSWGYQTTGFFAPTSRYGTPDELCTLIDACHAADIGVIFDFVPVHFAVDEYGLKHFDGTALYEYPAAAVGESEWGSCNFMHSRGEIRCFLQSAADYWLRTFHADGLRMDAVSRLIYWQGDPARGVNGSTLEFLKNMNQGLQQRHPTAMLIAEDSTNFEKVTAPVEYGGLGFDYKWDLGWMNDTLDYFKKTPEERKSNLGKLTFSMMYFWREHYILPFSHDENVHGKATILQKMYGEYEDKFPQGRALYLYMAIHPGKMLDFMGNEFGQLREYDESREQDWLLLDYPIHEAFANYRRTLNELYRKYDAFWSGEYNPDHFLWLDCDHPELDACAILRKGQEATVFAAFNFGDTELKDYELTLPGKGKITPLLNSDWNCFGGRTARPKALRSKTTTDSVKLTLAPYSAQLYRFEPAVEKETK